MSKLNEAIIKIRCDLQNSNMKKSGKNKFAGFTYYELSDILPTLNKLLLENGVNDLVSITLTSATLTLIKGEEKQLYEIPFFKYDTPLSKAGKESMQPIQYLGALNTYYKRYLYLNAFGITDGEIIDGMNNDDIAHKQTVTTKLASALLLNKIKNYSKLNEALKYWKLNSIEELSEERALKLLKKFSEEVATNTVDISKV